LLIVAWRMIMTATALKRPRTKAAVPDGDRPDRCDTAVALRRQLRANSLADSALEDSYPDPATADIHDQWVNGDITSAERIAKLNDFYRLKHPSAPRG
jgi:hypothetical protein